MKVQKNKMLDIFYKLIMKEKYACIIACICCTGLLCYEISLEFFVVKPTASSVEEINLAEIKFPDVLVCVRNGFSRKMLKRYGYDNSFEYYVGPDKFANFIGWSGLNNEEPVRNDADI